MSAGFVIAQDQLTPVIKRLAEKLTPSQQHDFVLGWAMEVEDIAYRNARSKGGRKFWNDLAGSIRLRSIGPAGAEVYSAHPAAAQKQFGGVIEAPGKGPGATGARFLTIPLRGSAAVGKTVGDFKEGGSKLFVLGKRDDAGGRGGILARIGAGGAVEPLFILCKRTKPQRAEPWFPNETETLELGSKMADKKLATL